MASSNNNNRNAFRFTSDGDDVSVSQEAELAGYFTRYDPQSVALMVKYAARYAHPTRPTIAHLFSEYKTATEALNAETKKHDADATPVLSLYLFKQAVAYMDPAKVFAMRYGVEAMLKHYGYRSLNGRYSAGDEGEMSPM